MAMNLTVGHLRATRAHEPSARRDKRAEAWREVPHASPSVAWVHALCRHTRRAGNGTRVARTACMAFRIRPLTLKVFLGQLVALLILLGAGLLQPFLLFLIVGLGAVVLFVAWLLVPRMAKPEETSVAPVENPQRPSDLVLEARERLLDEAREESSTAK